MNQLILMGRLCTDAKVSQTTSGVTTCRFRIAVNRRFKNKQTGQYDADFFSCTAWRQTAEFIAQYFHKGDGILLSGSVQNNDYTDQNGYKHYGVQVQVEDAYFPVGGRQSAQGGQTSAVAQGVPEVTPALGDLSGFEEILNDGDVPF